MGNKVSSLTGVRSSHFYEPGNAVNEIWLGDFELISHLPFGAPDIDQTGFQKGTHYPMIPWKPFIIPLSGGNDGSVQDGTIADTSANLAAQSDTKIAKRTIDSVLTSTSNGPYRETIRQFLGGIKGKISSSPTARLLHLPNTLEVDFVCWLVMQFLAVIALLIPLWLAVDMLVRAFETPWADEEESQEHISQQYADNETGSSDALDREKWDNCNNRHDTDGSQSTHTGTDTFASTITRASIGTIFYFLAIILIRAHDIAMHISPECISILTAPRIMHHKPSSPSGPNQSIRQYPSPPAAACPAILPSYLEDMDRYISGHWSGPFRALMTSLCVLAVFAVGCLWSDVILLLADRRKRRSVEQTQDQGQMCKESTPKSRWYDDHDILLGMLDESDGTGETDRRTPERITDSSDAIWTLVS
ncbi:hypothetical protein AAP_00139 [Ascosphaera apis ARSEF 7405]|uniref:Uncharacterized protein n=1 Tax=Ascosphaera apis ARSEF 7405 TaxID=392613 RepID=A0A168DLM7_9EURO|nr:hypothetical protein AAP_00139 [Ascosphaera apis ARSEF 7405]